MRFTISAVLALASIARNSDAFLLPTPKLKTTAIRMSQSFEDALAPKDENSDDDMMPVNPDELSVEDQARMFREMMAGKTQGPVEPPPVSRVSREDRAGRPMGRNPDADKITNTSDLYFAQLKRDSTVRTIARIRENKEVSEAVFQDDGIKELDALLQQNPYLQGQRDEDRALLDNLPDEVVAPYFRSDAPKKEDLLKTGVSYKKKLMERQQKKLGEGSAPSPAPAPVEEAKVEQLPPPPPPTPEPEPVVAQETAPEPVAPTIEEPKPLTVTSSNDARKQNIRTLMGLTLKHRGGPGFGKGRLKGPDIDLFEGLVDEVSNMLRDEAKVAPAAVDTPIDAPVEVAPVQAAAVVSTPEPPPAASTGPANIDATIACIEGAITMYKNSPPAIRESVLATLRAALMSAVDTCNVALASPAPAIAAGADASVEGMVACIEGAVTMYKNSPPALKDSVLATLRMALMSAVETCNVILSPGQAVAPPAPVAPEPVAPAPVAAAPVAPQAPPSDPAPVPPSNAGTDRNSQALEEVLEKLRLASGDGKLGLRSDLTSAEATELANELVGMRGILMGELEAGIPDPSGTGAPQPVAESPQESQGSSSRYEEMLAKARADKAAKANSS